MTVDLLPETMRFVSVGEDGRLELEFVFEVTCGLARFTLPVAVGGRASIDEALAEATRKVRSVALDLAKAARSASWADQEPDKTPMAGRHAATRRSVRTKRPSSRIERHNGTRPSLVAGEPNPATVMQCRDAMLDVA